MTCWKISSFSWIIYPTRNLSLVYSSGILQPIIFDYIPEGILFWMILRKYINLAWFPGSLYLYEWFLFNTISPRTLKEEGNGEKRGCANPGTVIGCDWFIHPVTKEFAHFPDPPACEQRNWLDGSANLQFQGEKDGTRSESQPFIVCTMSLAREYIRRKQSSQPLPFLTS